jgi:hypothetical protein
MLGAFRSSSTLRRRRSSVGSNSFGGLGAAADGRPDALDDMLENRPRDTTFVIP